MNIRIGNRVLGDRGEYVGRPTPLGNPFRMEPGPEDQADESEDAAEDGDDWWPDVDAPQLTPNRQESGGPGRPALGAPGPGEER